MFLLLEEECTDSWHLMALWLSTIGTVSIAGRYVVGLATEEVVE